MAARGNEAKDKLIQKISQAPGVTYLGCYDKKYYFTESENGEQIQIAVSLTCPKAPVEFAANVSAPAGDWDFSDNPAPSPAVAIANAGPAEITEEEQANVAELLRKLGL